MILDSTIYGAVSRRDAVEVRRMLAAGLPTEERDMVGATALIVACGSDQFAIAEMLIEAGADRWAFDQYGITPAHMSIQTGVPEDSPDGQARARIIASMQAAGLSWPPPAPAEVLTLAAAGRWPPRPKDKS